MVPFTGQHHIGLAVPQRRHLNVDGTQSVIQVFTEVEWQSLDADEQAAARRYIKVSFYDDLLVDIKEVFDKIHIV